MALELVARPPRGVLDVDLQPHRLLKLLGLRIGNIFCPKYKYFSAATSHLDLVGEVCPRGGVEQPHVVYLADERRAGGGRGLAVRGGEEVGGEGDEVRVEDSRAQAEADTRQHRARGVALAAVPLAVLVVHPVPVLGVTSASKSSI